MSRCDAVYGSRYQAIVDLSITAPEKLGQLAGVFAEGLNKDKLCLVGMISSDIHTLDPVSSSILEKTLQGTVNIFSRAFKQGRKEGSLRFSGTDKEAAYAFFSFLVGVQIAARVKGGEQAFRSATKTIIKGWET